MASCPPKAICVPCGKEYQAGPGKTGVWVLAKLNDGQPCYKIMGDIWVCPGCGHKAVLGFAKQTIEPFEKELWDDVGQEIDVNVVV